MKSITFTVIGTIESCFKEKFGIPRQPRLAPSARAILNLHPLPEIQRALKGLEGFSHAWILFAFHQIQPKWKATVRPPRLGGTRKMGVFATRSPHRPNPIGLSAVEIERVDGSSIHLKGVDFLDGTPVLDIKPYLPYSDSIPRARTGWVEESHPRLPVRFSAAAARRIRARPEVRTLIRQVLRLDPRPAFQRGQSGEYAARLLDVDVHWIVDDGRCRVTKIV